MSKSDRFGLSEFEGSPKNWPPLGMPTGSVRALLTLILVAVVITRVVQVGDADIEKDIDLIWIEALLIALSHYFTSRRFVELPPHVLKELEEEGVVEKERHPLFLPRSSIRIIIVAAFGWLTYFLYQNGRLSEPHALSLLCLLGAFILGSIVRRIFLPLHRHGFNPSAGTMGDIKALIVLVALLVIAVPEFLGSPQVFPEVFHRVVLAMTLFYFGSR
jgi:hypothetical protein